MSLPECLVPALGTAFFGRERLTSGKDAVEGGMLDDVAHEQVSTAAGHSGRIDVRRSERFRQRRVLLAEVGEPVEHLPVARRVRAPARDHVAPVRPTGADRVDVLAAFGQRLAQPGPERGGRVPVQGVRPAGDRDHDLLAVGSNR